MRLKKRTVVYRRLNALMWAIKDARFKKATYSQFGEDKIIEDLFSTRGGIRPEWIYIDVGANHPTMLNDTFLFYLRGLAGICIEPNPDLASTFGIIRPRDLVLNVVAGNEHDVRQFYETDETVFSSLLQNWFGRVPARSYLVPVIRLSDLAPYLRSTRIFLLKIDTEGFDQEVLEGASDLLHSTMVVLTETTSEEERQRRTTTLGAGWKIAHADIHNTIFVNTDF